MNLTYGLNTLYQYLQKKRVRNFFSACEDPITHQQKMLFHYLKSNNSTIFGKDHSFSQIQDSSDFIKHVKINSYNDIESYIEKCKQGIPNVLTSSPIRMFEKSSGSTKQAKYIPYTNELFNEFHNATSVWIHDLYKNYYQLKRGKAYWSLSPKFDVAERTSANIQVGFDHDLDYFSFWEKPFLKRMMVIPNIRPHQSTDSFLFETSLALLKEKKLSFISIWSPTFLLEILNYLDQNISELKRKLMNKRQNEIDGYEKNYKKIWPNLKLVSCWGDGCSETYKNELQTRLGDVVIQKKGLLSTEGIISFPLKSTGGAILAIHSHYFEFLSMTGELVPLSDLVIGEKYLPIITTGGGLYRYKTGDIIKITGKVGLVPLIEFIGREGITSDLCGEKIDQAQIQTALQSLYQQHQIHPLFAMVAPETVQKKYILYLESDSPFPNNINQSFDQLLCKSHHYKLCRNLNQLEQAQVVKIKSGWLHYQEEMLKRGTKSLGDIKPTVLPTSSDWYDAMVRK